MKANQEMNPFNEGVDMSSEGDGGVRGGFKFSNLYIWKEEALEKADIEDDHSFLDMLSLKHSREYGNGYYVPQ